MNKDPDERCLLSDKEQEEDFLEEVYLLQKRGISMTQSEIRRRMNMTKWEFKRIHAQLLAQDYVTEDMNELVLTEMGNIYAQKIFEKHHYLTTFLQMICGIEEEEAEDNACRMEHVISDHIFCGVVDFMRNGNQVERIIRHRDLKMLYGPGSYKFAAGIYLTEKRFPRVLSKEHYWFGKDAEVVVGENSCVYLSVLEEKRDELENIVFWYLDEQTQTWVCPGHGKGKYEIPSDTFTFTLCDQMPVIEADAVIAFTAGNEPEEADIRELNLHLW